MKRLAVVVCFALASVVAVAQDEAPRKAASLDELLRMVEAGEIRETAEHRAREQRFAAAKSEQERLLREARQQIRAAEKRSVELERTFETNERRTSELTELLDDRLGSMKEMFGVLSQVAGDTQGLLASSLISAQFPERSRHLIDLTEKFDSTTRLATIEEIEQLWVELQREMTESGKVARFQATVTTVDGDRLEQQVVRVGPFNIVSEGKYLQYVPETGNLMELPRQPQGRFVKTTGELAAAQSGFVKFGLDPSRGSILGLLIQAPSPRERIDQGGLIGYLILALGGLALVISLERIVVLGLAGRKVDRQLKSDTATDDNALGRVLLLADRHKQADLETLELKMGEAILSEVPKLSRGLLFLKTISVVAPLMGLLGTVTGMINTFQAITLFGTGDPKLMAGGISQALMTTVLGLAVAIPSVLLFTAINGRSKRIIHILDEQAVGIVAEHAEAAMKQAAS